MSPQSIPDRTQPFQAWEEELSALCDGEIDTELAGEVAARVARDPAQAGRWLDYHRIGDALRSAELCPARDEHAFLDAFRARLAAEPVVLTPAAAAVAATPVLERRVRRWRWATGVSAGVAALAVGLGLQGPTSDRFAQERGAATAAAGGGNLVVVKTANGAMIRDARLEQYLAAHHRAGSPVAMPASFVRQATVQSNPACTNC